MMRNRTPIAAGLALLLALAAGGHAELPRIDLNNLDDLPKAPEAPVPGTVDDAPAPAAADDGDTAGGWQLRFWKMHWRRVASAYVEVDGQLHIVPEFDTAKPSSQGVSVAEWTAEHTTTRRVSLGGGLSREQKTSPPRDEAIAAATRLGDLTPGSYGHIASAKVLKVIGPEEMIVSELQLIDAAQVERDRAADRATALRNSAAIVDQKVAEYYDNLKDAQRREYRGTGDDDRNNNRNVRTKDDLERDAARYRDRVTAEQKQAVEQALSQRFKHRDQIVQRQEKIAGTQVRLLGFKTAGLREGERWDNGDRTLGPQIAVLPNKPAAGASRYGASRSVTAVSTELLKRGLSEERFTQLLSERGISQSRFAEMAREQMKQHAGYAVPQIVAAIERHKPAQPEKAVEPSPGVKPPPTQQQPRPAPRGGEVDFFE